MDHDIFTQLSLALAIAAGVSLVARLLRQPLVIGYIITGFLVGPSLLNVIHSHEAFESFSQIGICLLLFIIGLGLNVGIVKRTGKPVFVTFLAVAAGIGLLGFGASRLLGFTTTEALVMAVALLFSSTIIVVKSLNDKKEQSRLYGQIAIGLLLAEDVLATLALVWVSANSAESTGLMDGVLLLLKGTALASILTIIGMDVMPRLGKLFAASQELLYVFAIAWAFGVASVFQIAGFSLEVGALFAGVALAHLSYAQAISTKLKPLRDFFIVLFFIRLGETLGIDNLSAALLPAVLFSLLIVVGKPLIIIASLGALGYTKQTGFKAAPHLSQISEFSIVLVVLAQGTGMIEGTLATIMTLTAFITIAVSAYLMQYDDALYRLLQSRLSIFERAETKRELRALSHYPLVLLGYREDGYALVKTFKAMKKPYVVVDYNPDTIEVLERAHINHVYGDATDPELLDELGVHKSELIISTISDATTNTLLAEQITTQNDQAIFICHARSYDEAVELYGAGAAYVITPHLIGSDHINDFIQAHGNDKKAFDHYRQTHLQTLSDIHATP